MRLLPLFEKLESIPPVATRLPRSLLVLPASNMAAVGSLDSDPTPQVVIDALAKAAQDLVEALETK